MLADHNVGERRFGAMWYQNTNGHLIEHVNQRSYGLVEPRPHGTKEQLSTEPCETHVEGSWQRSRLAGGVHTVLELAPNANGLFNIPLPPHHCQHIQP